MKAMKDITAKELEFLACFGVEPRLLSPDEPWYYNDAAYIVEIDGLTVSFAIQPSYRDVRLLVRRNDQRLYELNALNVGDVRVIDEPGRDAIEIWLSNREWMVVQLRPSFEIVQEIQFD